MKKKPNIILILTDDQGFWSLGCYGNREIRTPNIDALAERGIRFENFFCTSPVCSPARASILTGTIPSQHGIHDWIQRGGGEKPSDPPIEYLEGIEGYTDFLARDGYVCGLSGKWHMGATSVPQKSYSHWFATLKGSGTYINADVFRGSKLEGTEGYLTDLITDDAIAFIDACCDEDKPFYLNLAYTAPHSPLIDQHKQEYVNYYLENCTFNDIPQEPRNPWIQQHPIEIQHSESFMNPERKHITLRDLLAGYYAAVQGVDDGVGRVVDKLRKRGILDNTLIVFMSDNGYNCGHHGIWGKGNCTDPLNLYDTSCKVPCIVSMPGVVREGVVSDSLLSAYDFMPTLLDFLGIENPNADKLPGRSFLCELTGKGEGEYHRAVAVQDEYGPARMIRTKEWKYVHRYPYGPHELYDLKNDPGERFNLLWENRSFIHTPDEVNEKAAELHRMMEDFFRKYVDPNRDGRVEPVCGRGQRCKVGPESTLRIAFTPHQTTKYTKK